VLRSMPSSCCHLRQFFSLSTSFYTYDNTYSIHYHVLINSICKELGGDLVKCIQKIKELLRKLISKLWARLSALPLFQVAAQNKTSNPSVKDKPQTVIVNVSLKALFWVQRYIRVF